MLSNFIKKLLFTRQFFMKNGTIEILRTKQILLPSSIIHDFQTDEGLYDSIKTNVKKEFHEIANNFGSKREDLIKNITDIFDIYGLGKLELVDVNEESKSANLNLFNSAIAHAHIAKNSNSKKPICNLTSAVLAGIFSFIFNEDVDCYEKNCFGKGDEFCEFVIKKRGGSDA